MSTEPTAPAPAPLALTLTIGEHAAQLIGFDKEHARLISPEAAAPGARLSCTLQDGRVLKLKVHRCVRTDAGFRIEGGAFDLRRELRLELQSHFAVE